MMIVRLFANPALPNDHDSEMMKKLASGECDENLGNRVHQTDARKINARPHDFLVVGPSESLRNYFKCVSNQPNKRRLMSSRCFSSWGP
jgi:ABC-type Fe3+ transport system substrate-binding protein